MPKIMRNGVAYGKGGKIIIHNGVAYGGSHVAKLVEKTITANGTYNASTDGADGYSAVSVDVKDVYIEAAVESGGYSGAGGINLVLAPDNGTQVSDERCRLKNVVFLPAGTYTIDKSPTADSDLQFNIAQHRLGVFNSTSYAFFTAVVGSWAASLPVTLTLAEDRYISVLVRKENNVSITPTTAGGYVVINKA